MDRVTGRSGASGRCHFPWADAHGRLRSATRRRSLTPNSPPADRRVNRSTTSVKCLVRRSPARFSEACLMNRDGAPDDVDV